jgi:hypothetical protein
LGQRYGLMKVPQWKRYYDHWGICDRLMWFTTVG